MVHAAQNREFRVYLHFQGTESSEQDKTYVAERKRHRSYAANTNSVAPFAKQPEEKTYVQMYVCQQKTSEARKAGRNERENHNSLYHLDNASGIPRAQKLHEAEAAAPVFRHRFLRVRTFNPLLRSNPYCRDVHLEEKITAFCFSRMGVCAP